ncbi:MAG: glycosyltransferase [Candidatus Margulisbacteria bacterium]|nr:glycosyltransferase [Candidatus Margulisiibacteriota bacterium]MBU1021095.1 glycosyltransferase [Candidatus Margulisiibacteriota bacterium]MBU1728650.1 glycosyltransferase [Candidatus Margulisiibacteriota bacterium]MBU1955101.1 glycosyltransferase [Candidatus Margulisiibacteriota bacterium]
MSKNGNKKKTVLIIVSKRLDFGGGERVASAMAEELILTSDFYPILCTLKDVDPHQVESRRFPVMALNNKKELVLSNFIKLFWIILKYRIKVVHAHGHHAAFYAFLPAFLLRVKKRIWHFHAVPGENLKKFHLFFKLLFKLSTDIVACSKAVAQALLEEFNAPASKLRVIYNGLANLSAPPVGKPQHNKYNFQPCLGMVARIDGQKGHDDMLAALRLLREKHPKIGVVFRGDGEYAGILKEKIKAQGLTAAVCFAEKVEPDQLGPLYTSFDIFVLPSLMEAGPISILEAMYFSVPVVATAVGGVEEMVDNQVDGLLVPPRQPKMLAEAITKLINDQNLYKQIQSNALEKVKRFTMKNTVSELKQIYAGA